jgi:hypothetical protein
VICIVSAMPHHVVGNVKACVLLLVGRTARKLSDVVLGLPHQAALA